jgi:hypothetical protein
MLGLGKEVIEGRKLAQQKRPQEVARQAEAQRPRYAAPPMPEHEQGLSLEHGMGM